MNRTKGFTLIELLIVVAIILIVLAAIWGAIGPRKAGAHELFPNEMRVLLAEKGVNYIWNPSGHTIRVMDKGTADWADAQAACAALAAVAPDVRPLTVVMPATDTSGTAELRWESGGEVRAGADVPAVNAHGDRPTLTNLPTSTQASC